MQHYIVRLLPEYDFYVAWENPLTVSELKGEMFLQLEANTRDMTIIYKGEVLKDETFLPDVGVESGSIVYLHVKNLPDLFLMSPKRLINEIFSLYNNLTCVSSECFKAAVNDIKLYIDSPRLKPIYKLVPELKELFDDILADIDSMEFPLDYDDYRIYSKTQDDWFNQCELPPNGMSQIMHDGTEIVSIAEVEIANDDFEMEENHEDENTDLDVTTNLNYTPSINSSPLPTTRSFMAHNEFYNSLFE